MEKIIIDTDPGIDDALAIMLGVKSKMFDLKAITTVMGNSTIENTTRNAKWIMDCLNEENIPIYSGASKPLAGNFTCSFCMGEGGLGGVNKSMDFNLTNNAVEKMIELVNENPGEITIVAIGPLTNIALAIEKDPSTMKNLKKLIIMGGAIKVPGNMNRVAEFNVYNDPEAAEIVFNSEINKVLVPLDLCNSVELTLEDFNKIKGSLGGAINSLIGDYISRLEINETGKKVALVYDALAMYYLLNPSIYDLQNLDLRVETKGNLTRGMTVGDFRKTSKKNNNFSVAMNIDIDVFKKDFLGIISREDNFKIIEKRGFYPGKTTVLLAGVHGNEVCGVKAFDEIIPNLKIRYGKVIFIYANLKAIEQNKRQIEKNLNRCFLKDQPSEIAESLEGRTAREIMPYLDSADLMLDLHASYTPDSIPFVLGDVKQLKNANIFDTDIASYNWDEFEPGSTDYYMNLQNKPGFCFECGYLGDINAIERAKKAVQNFLVFSGNIGGKLKLYKNQKVIRIKSIYRNKDAPFRKSRYFKDFEMVTERTIIGYEGERAVFIEKGDIVLFLIDNRELGKECFLLAEETLLNSDKLEDSEELK